MPMWLLLLKDKLINLAVVLGGGLLQGGAAMIAVGTVNYAMIRAVGEMAGVEADGQTLAQGVDTAREAVSALPVSALGGVTFGMCLDFANQFVPLLELGQLATAYLATLCVVCALRSVKEWAGVFKR